MRKRNVKPSQKTNQNDSVQYEKAARAKETQILAYSIPAAIVLTSLLVFYLTNYGNSIFILEKSNLQNASLPNAYDPNAWGSYRPHVYFGLKTRKPASPLVGLVWYRQTLGSVDRFRHGCRQEDGIKYMWHDSDGETFGHQRVIDNELSFETNWLGFKHSFASEIKLHPISQRIPNAKYTFVFYFYLENEADTLFPEVGSDGHVKGYIGNIDGIGKYRIRFESKNPVTSEASFKVPPTFNLVSITDVVQGITDVNEEGTFFINQAKLGQNLENSDSRQLLFVQFTVEENAVIRMHFEGNEEQLEGNFEDVFNKKLGSFRKTFDEKYELKQTNYPANYETMGRAALSNMLGSIGYWYGYSEVDSGDSVKPYGPLSLLSGVPSRPFFPRGFLWDEGFHNLLIKNFNPSLTLNILSSWLDSMTSTGWIPREMILDPEARSKVPAEFITQHPDVANPPMFFYVIESLMRSTDFMTQHSQKLVQFYPRLKQFYLWLKETQKGPKKGTFRWRGRNGTTDLELNPKTLPSGLDDFPRASHPTNDEYHLDLLCWMALSSRVLRQIAEYASDTAFMPEIEEDMELFNSIENLNKHHWSESKQRYFDYGLHSENVALKEIRFQDKNGQIHVIKKRDVKSPPKLQLVENVYGYLNLFPFLLRLLHPTSDKLGIILKDLKKEELWTPFGLRSTSSKSPYYMRYNTQHDGPYWRGPIWINMNYLALASLKHYSSSGPHSELARSLYSELRQNVITNIATQYESTGHFWEHYNDKSGKGAGSHPFTGWTALVLNIMAEKYD
uniref:Mannosyl-oligosaccharide glucosidase n=1 Tax=Panagrolaimus sp. ES5 TaxID=591445 RepID=A0AC34F8W5_9BILA